MFGRVAAPVRRLSRRFFSRLDARQKLIVRLEGILARGP